MVYISNEEKEALKLLDEIISDTWTTKYIMSSDSKKAEILLNYIDKLQENNAELECKYRRKICIEAHEQIRQLYIEKVIIEAKIKENEKRVLEYCNDGDLIHELQIENRIYKQLLKESEV